MLASCARRAPILSGMATRDDTKAWLKAVLDYRGMRPTEVARRAGLAPSTINRFLNDPGYGGDLKRQTLEAIGSVVGVEPYVMPGPKRIPGFAEIEAVPYLADKGEGDPLVDLAVRSRCEGNNAIAPWILSTRALERAGYLPGDVVLVDLNERPLANDAVCAQIYDWSTGRTETVMRIFHPPYLLAATADDRLMKPFVVDDDNVVIKGVIVMSLRPRRASAPAR